MTSSASPEQKRLARQIYESAAGLPARDRRSFLEAASNDAIVVREALALLDDPHAPASGSTTAQSTRTGMEISHYRVGACIGRGGMGEVYEATDLALDRKVAIKFLPEFVLASERAIRHFQVEAKSASSLNHPNLVTIHEFIREGDVLAIVMEHIDGVTLREVLKNSGPLHPDLFLKYARQLAEGLAAAHGRGIIHRDLKPENIMIRADGYVKILDFGLAGLAVDANAEPAVPAHHSFSTVAGTLRYMSPEQRTNAPLTTATDIYSLGLVFAEMQTGDPTSQSLAFPSMRNEDPATRPTATQVAGLLSQPRDAIRRRKSAIALATAIAALLVAYRYLGPSGSEPPPPAPSLEVQPLTAFQGEEFGVSFSRDGKRVVFSWNGERQDNFDIYAMDLRERIPRRLTSNPAPDRHPAWSPDGKTIAFHREGPSSRALISLLPIDGSGAPAATERIVGEVVLIPSQRRVLDWSPDSQWLVLHDTPPGQNQFALYLQSAQTGERRQLTQPPLNERHCSPAFSPDGRRILFVRDFGGVSDLAVLSLTPELRPAGSPSPLHIADFKKEFCSNPRWTRDGKSVLFTYNRGGSQRLWQMPVDPSIASPVTPALVPVGEGAEFAAFSPFGDQLAFTRWSMDRNLWQVLLPGAASQTRQLISSTKMEQFADISPDGTRIVFESDRSGFTEVWVSDANGGNARPLTRFQGPGTGSPRWSPDGRWIAFDTRVDGQPEIYLASVELPSDPPRRLTNHPGQDKLPAWSPDGRWIYFTSDRSGVAQAWRVPFEGGDPSVISPRDGRGPLISPDGRWVYFSRGSGESSDLWRTPADGAGPETIVLKDLLDRSFVPGATGIWFLRRHHAEGTRTSLVHHDLATRTDRILAELGDRVQPGLTISKRGHLAIFTRADEGTRDLMLVDGLLKLRAAKPSR